MLRAVVAVALASALLATTLPAVETTTRERTATHVASEVDRLETAIADLRAREQAAIGPGARRVVAVRVPGRDWTHAGVDYLAIGGTPDGREPAKTETAFAWRVHGSDGDRRRVAGIPVEPGTCGDGALVLREPGVHRLALRLVERGGKRRILVRELG